MECGLSAVQLVGMMIQGVIYLVSIIGFICLMYGFYLIIKRLRAQKMIVSWEDKPAKVKAEGSGGGCRIAVLTSILTVIVMMALGLGGYLIYLVVTL